MTFCLFVVHFFLPGSPTNILSDTYISVKQENLVLKMDMKNFILSLDGVTWIYTRRN